MSESDMLMLLGFINEMCFFVPYLDLMPFVKIAKRHEV